MEVKFTEEVKQVASGIFLATATMENVKVKRIHEYTEHLKREVTREFRQAYSLDKLAKDSRIEAFRRLYWTFEMDPTKTRPSSEALARRVLSGSELPTINIVVDSNNAMSLKHLLPIGVYDADKLEGALFVRIAKKEETITKIGGKIEILKGNELIVSDEKKIIGLGYASSDSDITKVSEITQRLSILIYCAPETSAQAGEMCLEDLINHISQSSGGACVQRSIVS